jgi:hypothetical protein
VVPTCQPEGEARQWQPLWSTPSQWRKQVWQRRQHLAGQLGGGGGGWAGVGLGNKKDKSCLDRMKERNREYGIRFLVADFEF